MTAPTPAPATPLSLAAPVYQALITPVLIAGAPRTLAIANATLAAAIGLGFRLWVAGLVLGFAGHLASVWLTRRDPAFPEVARRHLRLPPHFGV
jgi:type IV secretion system protein VirB3